LQCLPGIREAIEEATRLRLKLAVASSSSRAWVTGMLNQVGLVPYFDCIYTSDDVSRIKPDPELFRAAVNGLGIQPHEALAFEDSPNGVTSAKAAGLFCVAIPNTITSTLSLDHADLILPSLAERPLGELLNYFNNNHHS
jgi:HAD superfamily hydrolase (TIGR01509 family)